MKRRAKILLFLFLILLLLGGFFGFSPQANASASIIINEIATGQTGFVKNEFIELYNPTASSINLSGYKLKKKTKSRTESYLISSSSFTGNIPSQGYFLISPPDYKDTIAADLTYSGTSYSIADDNTILLYDAGDQLIDKTGYGSATDFETQAAINPVINKSIERKNFQDTDNNNVDFDLLDMPTPHNSSFTEAAEEEDEPLCAGNPSDIKINEIYPNTEDEDDEFVEILNIGADCVDISNWAIKDATTISSHKTILPDNTILESGEFFYIEKNLYLNNDTDTVYLLDKDGLEKDKREYAEAIRNKSYSFDGTDWFWTSHSTKGAENQFDPVEDASNTTTDTPAEDTPPDYDVYLNEILPNPKGDEKLEEFIEIYNAEDLEINLAGWTLKDSSKTKYTFPADTKITAKEYLVIYRTDFKFAMNNSGSETIYLLNTTNEIVSSVSYDDAKEDVSYNFDDIDWHWSSFLTPSKENEFEKKLTVSIVKIKANPKGNDTDKKNGEEIYLKNKSREKVNLKTWSIATGSKTLANHPITKDFIIKPGKTKKITRKYSLFTLNNKKGTIELRYPNGEVASRVRYDKKKESVKDDEVYELSGKKWHWSAPPEENPTEEIVPAENSEDTILENELEVSAEEITLNLGKYSSENRLALIENRFMPVGKNLLQSRENSGIVLGAFSVRNENHKPIEIKPTTSWDKTLQKSNRLLNLLINRLISFI